MSNFLLQIVHRLTGEVVRFEPGRQVERDFVDDCVAKIVGKGVGWTKSTAHVARDVRAGIEEAIFELKARVPPGSV